MSLVLYLNHIDTNNIFYRLILTRGTWTKYLSYTIPVIMYDTCDQIANRYFETSQSRYRASVRV
jgi:hypothetical protein